MIDHSPSQFTSWLAQSKDSRKHGSVGAFRRNAKMNDATIAGVSAKRPYKCLPG